MKGHKRGLVLAILLAAGVVAAHWLSPSLQGLEGELTRLRQKLGAAGLIVFGMAFTPCCLVMLPAGGLLLLGGYFYGTVQACLSASLGMTVAAGGVFLAGRTVARRWVEGRFGQDRRFQALDRSVAEQGFRVVLLMRLSPLFPFVVLNYLLSLTHVRFRSYLLATCLGMLPNIALWCYLGSTMKDLADLQPGRLLREQTGMAQTWKMALGSVGALLGLAATGMIAQRARRTLNTTVQAKAIAGEHEEEMEQREGRETPSKPL